MTDKRLDVIGEAVSAAKAKTGAARMRAAARLEQLLARWRAEQFAGSGRCSSCGYKRRGRRKRAGELPLITTEGKE